MSKPTPESIAKANSVVRGYAEKPVGVFIGGTSGVGLHTAYAFAKYTNEPTIYIIGRDATAGNNALEEIKRINPSAKGYFLKHDLHLLSEVDTVVKEVKSKETKINTLCVTAGALTIASRDETPEGIDKKMAINYYSRWRAISELVPLVQAANKLKEPSRVVSVLKPGIEGKLNLDDLELKENFGLLVANTHSGTMNSLAVFKFARDYPELSFTHADPGIVSTGITRGLPWWIRVPLIPVFYFFSDSSENVANRTFYEGYAGEDYKTGGHVVSSKMDDLYEGSKKFLGQDLQDVVWKHTQDLYEKVRGSKSS